MEQDPEPPQQPVADEQARAREKDHWRRNVRYVASLLSVWFAVSFLGGIVFVDALNQVSLPGTSVPLGFWIAQQGSIYVFVVLIFVYVRLMNRLDAELGMDEKKQ